MIDDLDREIDALISEGDALWFQGKPRSATDVWAKAVRALQDGTDPVLTYRAKKNLAMGLRDGGQIEAAIQIYEELHRFCEEMSLDSREILFGWAIALEVDQQFSKAISKFELIKPDNRSSPIDRMKWENSVGLLYWSMGSLERANTHLSAATVDFPTETETAANHLAVLGNAAKLAILIEDKARAHRIVDQMLEVYKSVETIPLVSELSVRTVQASLLSASGAHDAACDVLNSGLQWLEENEPDERLHWLDMLGTYAIEAQKAGDASRAIEQLGEACQSVPEEWRWIGLHPLAQLHLETGRMEQARATVTALSASIIGNGPVERDTEFIELLVTLAHDQGTADSTVFLGKLMLKYLVQNADGIDWLGLRNLLKRYQPVMDLTIGHLNRGGRVVEAQALADLLDRVRRYVLYLGRTTPKAAEAQPVPFDAAEAGLEQQYLEFRQQLVALRSEDRHDEAQSLSDHMITTLLSFQRASGSEPVVATTSPPAAGVLRMALVRAGDACDIHYQWAERRTKRRVPVASNVFFDEIARLREAMSDPLAWRHPGNVLYDWLIKPIEDALDAVDILEIDASDALGQLPMAVLTDGRICLTQRVAVRYMIKVDPPAKTAEPRQGLAYFTPFETGALGRRPGSLRGDDGPFGAVSAFVGQGFSREALMAALRDRPACLSVATHLENEPTRPELCSLQLAGDAALYLQDFAGPDFDLNGIEIALFAACGSALGGSWEPESKSLAAIVLEKGAKCCVGTLWPISETAAADFLSTFWQVAANNRSRDPALMLSEVQRLQAAQSLEQPTSRSSTGGIGAPATDHLPEHWAGFAVFQPCNT